MKRELGCWSICLALASLLVLQLALLPCAAVAQEDPDPASTAPTEEAAPAAVEPTPATEPDPAATVQEIMQLAYAKTKTAKTLEDYAAIIQLCEEGIAKAPDKAAKDYLVKLLAWGYNRHGKLLSEQASGSSDAEEIAALEARALAYFEQSVKLDPKKWQALHNRGVSYAFAGKLREALADFNATIKLNSKYPNVWFNRGEIYYQLGDYAAAVSDYTQASTLSPGDAGAVAARGHAYYQLKQYRNSLQDYNRAVQMSPDNVTILTDRGEVYANLGYWQQAATDFSRAVELDETFGRAYMDAAWIMATCPDERYLDANAALTSAEKAIELDGEDDWRYLDALAAAYASAAQFDKAQTAIAKAIAAAPEEQQQNLAARQELYAQDKPYRESARTASTTSSRSR